MLFDGRGSIEICRRLRSDFEVEYAFHGFAIEKNLAGLTLEGLCAPPIVAGWPARPYIIDSADAGPSVIAFQTRLDERITYSSGNHSMVSQHWEVLERTHEFRLHEFLDPSFTHLVAEEISALVNALIAKDREQISLLLTARLKRRSAILQGAPLAGRRGKLHLVSGIDV